MRRIVFDLDDTLESPSVYGEENIENIKQLLRERWGDYAEDAMMFTWQTETNSIFRGPETHIYAYFAYPGAVELLRWVHQKGIAIDFYSSASKERNDSLCRSIMKAAFPDEDVPFRVFSTSVDGPEDDRKNEEYCEKYVGFYYGRYKKALKDFIVPESELPDTLLVDDDPSYAARGEEANLVFCCCDYCDYAQNIQKFHDDKGLHDKNYGLTMHRVYYVAGVLDKIVRMADERGISLRDAAQTVQFLDEGKRIPTLEEHDADGTIRYPFPYYSDAKYYISGLKVLQAFNPNLDFWNGIQDGWWDENGWSARHSRSVQKKEKS